MNVDWSALELELQQWAAEGRRLPIWWRDDDAVEPTPALERLLALSERMGLSVHLAVIPSGARPELADLLARAPGAVPVIHGWAHQNHAPPGEKTAEFGAHRPVEAMAAEIAAARARLQEMFGARLAAMFVPPWNRIAPDLVARLPAAGIGILSTYGPRRTERPAPGLGQVNTHVDPIDWRGSRGLKDPRAQIAALVARLADRRAGRADAEEPLGLLTHHLVQDEAIWAFTEALVERLLAGPVTPWRADRGEAGSR